MQRIISNKIQCKHCGEIIESKHVHDLVKCKCEICSIDGGHDYMRIGGNQGDWEDLSEWEAPLLFQGLVKKGIYTVSREASLMWVQERVIPSGRQNIGLILKTHKLKEYSEIALLSLSNAFL